MAVKTILDTAMCLLWMVTYTLVLIGTIKYRYPLISPISQAIIMPFEFSVLLLVTAVGQYKFNYASGAYLYWTLIEIVIIIVILKSGFMKKKHIVPYISFVVIFTILMVYLVTIKSNMFFFSYFNTFVGDVIWFGFILKNDYPMKPIALATFITKCVADILGACVYFGNGNFVINMMAVLLPSLDLVFILVYFVRKRWCTNIR